MLLLTRLLTQRKDPAPTLMPVDKESGGYKQDQASIGEAALPCAALLFPLDSALHPPKGSSKVARGPKLDGEFRFFGFGLAFVV